MPSSSPLAASRQVLLVLAEHWQSTSARLQQLSRADEKQAWQACGPALAVSLGRNGLAWGLGRHAAADPREKRKMEGDGCAPAGVFAIPALFGDAPASSPFVRALKLPYLAASSDLKCIDDPASCHYNRIVAQNQLSAADWQSHEDMQRADHRYEIGAVVAHNHGPQTRPGAGSCIFLHVWEAPGVPTAGCTAMALADMRGIATWLDGHAHPLLVQLPRCAYRARREAWQLPDFDNSPALP